MNSHQSILRLKAMERMIESCKGRVGGGLKSNDARKGCTRSSFKGVQPTVCCAVTVAWMDGRMDDGWTDGWMYGWVGADKAGEMNGRMNE